MKASTIVKKAAGFVGKKESPAGSNNVIFNTHYYGRKVSGAAYPWCCTFVWDVFRLCGASGLFCYGVKVAYCPSVEVWARNNGLIVSRTAGQAGDLVLFDFYGKGEAGHIGIIEKRNKDGTYTTIEGNTSLSSNDNGGAVMRRTRSTAVIRCIVRPKYNLALMNGVEYTECTPFVVHTKAKKTPLRKKPSAVGAVIKKYKAGTKITIIGKTGKYYAAKRGGFIAKKNVKQT